MTFSNRDGLDAGYLLRFGLRPKLRPSDDRNYTELVQRYLSDSTFADLTENVADGLGLRVLDVSERGIVLGSMADGPFALRLDDYRSGLRFEDRVCTGLIQLAIAAYCFPRSEDLWDDERGVFRISVRAVVKYLTDLCNRFRKESDRDPTFGSPELQEAWRVVLSRAETKETQHGSRSRTSLAGMVAHAIETLEREGMLRKESDDEGATYQVLYRYRIQVRELGNLQAFEIVQALTNGDDYSA
jgi:hypothetical protein